NRGAPFQHPCTRALPPPHDDIAGRCRGHLRFRPDRLCTCAARACGAPMSGPDTQEEEMSTKKSAIDQELIRDLAGILNDTNLTEIEVELGDLKVRVSRQAAAVHAIAAPAPVAAA